MIEFEIILANIFLLINIISNTQLKLLHQFIIIFYCVKRYFIFILMLSSLDINVTIYFYIFIKKNELININICGI